MINISNEHNLKNKYQQAEEKTDEIKKQMEAMLAGYESQAEANEQFTIKKAVNMMERLRVYTKQ